MNTTTATSLYGVLGEFTSADRLVQAARQAHAAGYRRLDAFTPFHVEGLTEAMGLPHTRLPWLVLTAGFAGMIAGLGLQYFVSVVAYPLNVGGRPLFSWPAFVPVAFEMAILSAALAAVLGMLLRSGLPRPHHPLFGCRRFEHASRNRFFLCIEADDPLFEVEQVTTLLQSAGAEEVEEVL